MPAGGYKVFVDGEVLPASDINSYLMQGILVFASEAARDSTIASPDHGMFAFTTDNDYLWVFDGSAWQRYYGDAGPADFSDTATGTYSSGGVDYKYISFTSSGSLTVTQTGKADILVVGGGGGASGNAAGRRASGGAGGYVYHQDFYLEAGTWTVVVGSGGTGQSNAAGNRGTDSAIYNGSEYLTAVGGGGGHGGGAAPVPGPPGGSGGGIPYTDTYPAALFGWAVTGQGNIGSQAAADHQAGGGAGGVGSGSTAGAGVSNSITGSAVTYAEGGGGTTGVTPAANTGNGGGSPGASGASGIVVVRVVTS